MRTKTKMKLNKEYVFVTKSGRYMVIKMVKRKGHYFYQSKRQDALESMDIKSSHIPLWGNFTWPQATLKRLIEREWYNMGEL